MQFFNIGLLVVLTVVGADDCQPINWKQDVGRVVCRYWAATGANVNYYTCTELSEKYGTLTEDFFTLNPELEIDCSNIQPKKGVLCKGM